MVIHTKQKCYFTIFTDCSALFQVVIQPNTMVELDPSPIVATVLEWDDTVSIETMEKIYKRLNWIGRVDLVVSLLSTVWCI